MTIETLTTDSEELEAPLPLQITVARKLCTEPGPLACDHCVAAAVRLIPTATGILDLLESLARTFGSRTGTEDEPRYGTNGSGQMRTVLNYLTWAGRMELLEDGSGTYRFLPKGGGA